MNESLIRGRHVVCRVTGRSEAEIVDDGAVLQRDGVIVEIGKWADLSGRYPDVAVLGSAHHVVLPGFVNSHHHVGVTPFQLGSPDYPLELWLGHRLRARAVDPHLDTLYSAFEMLESGITTVQHLHGRVAPPLENLNRVADQVIGAYQKIGMRVSYSFGIRDQNRLVYEEDEGFAQRLPSGLADGFRRWVAAQSVELADSFQLFEMLRQRYAENERVRVQLAPVNLHWCSDEALLQVKEYSERYDAPMHMHLLETRYQREYARRRTGGSAVEHLHKLGLLGERLTLGHGVWLSEAEIEMIAGTGTHLCTNASSNLRLRSGIAPLNHLEKHGVRIALGLDEAGINDDRDMLQEMRLVMNLHRVPGMEEADVPSSHQVFRMATENGALTTPFGASIGLLQPGKSADIVLIDWRQISHPYLDADTPVIDAVLHRAKAAGVDLVMVAGEVLLDKGRYTRIDKKAILDELAQRLSVPLSEEEQQRKQLSEALMPYVKSFYSGYCGQCDRRPFYREIQY